jgi:hypothetical protein
MTMEKLMKLSGTNLLAVIDADGKADVTSEAAVRIAIQLIEQMTASELHQVEIAFLAARELRTLVGDIWFCDEEAAPLSFGDLINDLHEWVDKFDGDPRLTRFDYAAAVIGWVYHFMQDDERTMILYDKASELYTAYCELPLERKFPPGTALTASEVVS